MPLHRSWLLFSEDLDHHPREKKVPCRYRRCISRYHFYAWVWNCQTLIHVVESHFITSFNHRYNQWLFDMNLIRRSAFYGLFSMIKPSFIAINVGLKLWRTQLFEKRKTTTFTCAVYDYVWDLPGRRFSCSLLLKLHSSSACNSWLVAVLETRYDALGKYISLPRLRFAPRFLSPIDFAEP